jgi:hypothetical protein
VGPESPDEEEQMAVLGRIRPLRDERARDIGTGIRRNPGYCESESTEGFDGADDGTAQKRKEIDT